MYYLFQLAKLLQFVSGTNSLWSANFDIPHLMYLILSCSGRQHSLWPDIYRDHGGSLQPLRLHSNHSVVCYCIFCLPHLISLHCNHGFCEKLTWPDYHNYRCICNPKYHQLCELKCIVHESKTHACQKNIIIIRICHS